MRAGTNLVPGGGATFRVWAPRATEVYINGLFGVVVLYHTCLLAPARWTWDSQLTFLSNEIAGLSIQVSNIIDNFG